MCEKDNLLFKHRALREACEKKYHLTTDDVCELLGMNSFSKDDYVRLGYRFEKVKAMDGSGSCWLVHPAGN